MSDAPSLAGARVLVVGASAGIGRSFVRHAVAQGADVCASARRHDKLVELCAEAQGGHPIAVDVTVDGDCDRLVEAAVERLGGLDLVLYTAGSGILTPLIETDGDVWRRANDVNVVAPMVLCRAALPRLAPEGVMSFMSSEASEQTRWGLAAYSASKAALDVAIRCWRHEHPDRRFQRIVMGATAPTEFGDHFSGEVLETAFARWAVSGIQYKLMETDQVGRVLADAMAVVLAHPTIDLLDLKLDARGSAWEPHVPGPS